MMPSTAWTWAAACLVGACTGFALSPSLVTLPLSTPLLGTAHLLLVISQQES